MTPPQKFEFQAEIRQLLDIVIHSLYTEKEIFVRELVSNASDALEKLRHLQLVEKEIFDDRLPLEINITTDDAAKTFTIQDFGVGMTRAELVEDLGTIAHSGSKAFLQALGENAAKTASLIGQFGVGFYSAFMVAKRVRVFAHSWRPAEPGHVWESDGSGSYTIEEAEGQRRGCKIVVELKDECTEFSLASRIEGILKRYSSFVRFPINLNGKRVNTIQALWLRNKNEIKEEEYTEFYKFQANAFEPPRLRLHFSADAPLAINALLFVPEENPERFGFVRAEPGVALYCRKILIDPHPKDLLPEWLRYLRGVVDSEDLPLNISRELTQDRSLLAKLSRVLTRRFIKALEEEAKERADSYREFYQRFSVYLKEGAALDVTYKDDLVKLLRYESSLTEPGALTSLADYVARMKDTQREIYYLVGPSRAALEAGPYLEGFRARNLEVLFCYENVDEYVMGHVHEFDGKRLIAADHADVKLEDLPAPPGADTLGAAQLQALVAWLKETLGDRVAEVKASDRLVGSPALALNADRLTSPHMRRLMKVMKVEGADDAPRVELQLNPRHAVIRHLAAVREAKPEVAKLMAEQVLDNALIAAGLLDDPQKMVARIYKLLENV
ncbi:MAG TPA: molecular chaperone HtpG [Opitutaceae bacterium]|nr:molecular chaperone HtpG [Opitutaceae bacterium]